LDKEIMEKDKLINLLKKSGYSQKSIDYYLNKLNVGWIDNPDTHFIYTGQCGDTMEIFLRIKSEVIKEAKFLVTGCAALHACGSALCEMIRDKNLDEAEKITEEDIISYLGKIPKAKAHCACLAKKTLEEAIKKYKEGN